MKRYYPAILFMLFILLVSGCAFRQMAVPEVTDNEFAAAYRNDLKTLSSDEFQGRKPGTPGGTLTQDYLINSFKSIGLEPGNNSSYLQEVKLSLGKGTALSIITVNSDGDSLNTEWNTHILPTIKGADDDLALKDKELVFVGFGSESEKFSWHDYEDIDVKGKIVIILRNHAGYAAGDSSIMDDPDAVTHFLFTTKYALAESHGASGTIVIFDPNLSTSAQIWEKRVKSFSKGQTSLFTENDTSTMKLEALISVEIGKQLLALTGFDYDSLLVAAYTPGFKAFNLGITFSGEFSREQTIYSSNNVLALIRGSKRPDEVVIYTAHWDHLGMNEALEGDSIFNGAADNGTGTASLLSLARAFKEQAVPPERSLLFIGYTAEEMGHLGSRYYADNPIFPLAKSVASINIDMLFFGGKTNDLIMFGKGKSELDEYAERAAAKYGMRIQDDLWPEEGIYYRSDHISLARKGLPSLFMNTGVDNKEYGQDWGFEHFNSFLKTTYHKVNDEYSDELNVDAIMQYLQVVFDIGYTLANSDKFPNWYIDDEFRPIRDASRAK